MTNRLLKSLFLFLHFFFDYFLKEIILCVILKVLKIISKRMFFIDIFMLLIKKSSFFIPHLLLTLKMYIFFKILMS